MKKNKVIVILGTTASGKTSLGVLLAYKLDGEIISADSRQVYRGMDIGTGKDLDEYKYKGKKIKYHLIDVANPKIRFDLAKYQKLTNKAIEDILKRGKLPIIVGGTGQYLQAVVDNFKLSNAKPDKKLREQLEEKEVYKLFEQLKKMNSAFANKLNNSDKNNKRRLIRYIEVFKSEGEFKFKKERNDKYEFLIIGLTHPRDILLRRIKKRLVERLEKEKMVEEVERLHKKEGVTWKRLEEFGLEYRYIAKYLQGKMEYEEMVEKLNIAIRQFAKKQMSWFGRWEKQSSQSTQGGTGGGQVGTKIFWVKKKGEINKKVNQFLKE